jgi:hypothetical protein
MTLQIRWIVSQAFLALPLQIRQRRRSTRDDRCLRLHPTRLVGRSRTVTLANSVAI